jgi:hypothetical protein
MENKKSVLLSLSGKNRVDVQFATADLTELKLGLFNPRFRHKSPKTEQEVEKEIWNETDIQPLYMSILQSKGISEPLYVRYDGRVEEGNRRLVCLRKIKQEYEDKPDIFPKEGYTKIPVYILPKDLDAVDLSVLLARLHVSGKKEWDALNQAQHIYDLKEMHGLTYEEISNLIGMSKGKIFQKYWAYKETKTFLSEHPDQPTSRYSFFEEAYKKSKMRHFLDLEKNKKELYSWIIDKKFDKSGAKDIRDLSCFIDNEKIMITFRKSGMKAAYIQYETSDDNNDDEFMDIVDDMMNSLKVMSREELSRIAKDRIKIKKIEQLAVEIHKLLQQTK